MIINFSSQIQASVKCSDGHCYPCLILSIITIGFPYTETFPKYGIRFTGLRPEDIIHREMVVNMLDVNLGDQDVKAR